MLQIFERRILKQILIRIYGPIKENGIMSSRHNHELNRLYNETDIVKVIKVEQLRWLEQFLECRSRTLAGS
jgi:hypothetical protein